MKKTLENTINSNQLEHLIQLLQKGYSINDAIDLLAKIKGNEVFTYLKNELLKGREIQSVLLEIYKDKTFTEMFNSLYPVKGLTYALTESLNMVKEKNKYIQLICKKSSYPLILVFIMAGFSLFVKFFLLPEIDLLFQSFNYNNSGTFNYVLIHLVPNILLLILVFIWLIWSYINYCIILSKNIPSCLKLPVISTIVKTYYSFKFSYYLSKLSTCFDSFYDTILYFYKTNQNTDLKLVLDYIYFQLEDGIELQTIIKNTPYFTDEFKHFFYLLLSTQQKLEQIEDYCLLTLDTLENKLKIAINVTLAFVYLCTGIYIMSLYSLIMLPVLEITTLL